MSKATCQSFEPQVHPRSLDKEELEGGGGELVGLPAHPPPLPTLISKTPSVEYSFVRTMHVPIGAGVGLNP